MKTDIGSIEANAKISGFQQKLNPQEARPDLLCLKRGEGFKFATSFISPMTACFARH